MIGLNCFWWSSSADWNRNINSKINFTFDSRLFGTTNSVWIFNIPFHLRYKCWMLDWIREILSQHVRFNSVLRLARLIPHWLCWYLSSSFFLSVVVLFIRMRVRYGNSSHCNSYRRSPHFVVDGYRSHLAELLPFRRSVRVLLRGLCIRTIRVLLFLCCCHRDHSLGRLLYQALQDGYSACNALWWGPLLFLCRFWT